MSVSRGNAGPVARWRKSDVAGWFAYLAVVCLVLLYFAHRWHADFSGLQPFWDARVYARALGEWRRGLDPYSVASPPRPGVILPFVSPPAFLYAMGLLSHVVPGHFGVVAYWCLAGVCTVAVPTLLAMFYLRSGWMVPALAVLVSWFYPGRYGSQALLTGNLSNVLYAALLGAGVPGIRRNRWLPFYIVIVFAGVMKPPFLAFLALPLLAGKRQWFQSVGAVLVVVATDVAQKMLLPGYWGEFQQSVYLRVFVQGDAGFGLLGQFRALGERLSGFRLLSPFAEYLLVLVPMAVLIVVLRDKRFGRPVERLWLPCLVVLAILSNPRILDYDASVAVVPAVYLVVEFLGSLPRSAWRGLQVGVALVLLLGLVALPSDAALCALLVISVLSVLVQLLWPRKFEMQWSTESLAHP